ncbi:hypothetical protein PLEOSDRAFT_1039350 [Pleurotus ostreatus PC15]|uniref:CxC6 like cysteine cluster associated with KDZ domain-containing protein n=1 Tax=Pleurotus ostreatus (strain PC15) TaxID=1137138 RepID=A0A067NNY0_PLEO1|nr:hypothetical protein PLEOSDRAFT_1039350 [Pleurotus ostreatus PC15]
MQTLSSSECLLDSMTIIDVLRFIQITHHIKSEIALHIPHGSLAPPSFLPLYIQRLLMLIIGFPEAHVVLLWSVFKDTIWDLDISMPLCKQDIQLISKYVSSCTLCKMPLKYSKLSRYRVTYFSVRHGSQHAYMTSIGCQACTARFYPTYYTHGSMHHYYSPQVPEIIQIEEHALVSADLCELFTFCMLFAWVSSQNCSHIFNTALSGVADGNPPSSLVLTSEQVSRAFTYNALHRESAEQHRPLVLRANTDNDTRLKEVMEARNDEYIIHGQPQRMHACMTYSFRAVVTDGITLGRPCCKVHNCTQPLPTNRAHFCKSHEKLKQQCVFVDCDRPAEQTFQTCSEPAHRQAESHHKAKGKGFFQLRKRLERHNIAHLADSVAPLDTETITDGQDLPMDPVHKSEAGNQTVKARFGRRRTHNEQLVVACCGVITGRATMFGAEAISGVKDALKSIYQTPQDLPDVIFFDNNCSLQAHLQKQCDTYFQGTLLPVDVFHFSSKHKLSDDFCQRHCNPAQWPELVNDDGSWKFNSSVAEQTNVWMGGYIAIVREMLPHRYEFFLDEMIKRRNQLLIRRLRNEGKVPYCIPQYVVA